jgi:hypothetical protein
MSDDTAVTIRDVTPRDGLQSEAPLPAATRAAPAITLASEAIAGSARIESR